MFFLESYKVCNYLIRAVFFAAVLSLFGCEASLNLEGVKKELNKSIHRTDQFQGLADNGHSIVAVGNYGVVLNREKGARDWQRQKLEGASGLIDVESCPDSTFIALDFERKIWRSQDNGLSWKAIPVKTSENLLDLDCAPDGSYWVVGSFSTLLSSNDEGQSWHSASLNEDAILTGIQFISPDVAFITGEFGTVARTDDGGISWQVFESMKEGFYPQATYFSDAISGWAVGLDGTLLETLNGGVTWHELETPVRAPLYGVESIDGALYIVGENAALLKREPGKQFVQLDSVGKSVYLRAVLGTDQTLLVAGGNGTLTGLDR